jgi:hypothetical protein
MALFLEIVGAVALVVLAIVIILIAYVTLLVHRAEGRDARWRPSPRTDTGCAR